MHTLFGHKKKRPLAGADMVCAAEPPACQRKGTKNASGQSFYICAMQRGHAYVIAQEVANCFLYEAFKKVEEKTIVSFIDVFIAFQLLGRVKAILGKRYEEIKSELAEKAKLELLANGYTEDSLNLAIELGIEIGESRPLPAKIDFDHYEFFADLVMEKIGYKIRCLSGKRWEVWDGRSWKKQPREIRLTSVIGHVLTQKIAIWQEAVKAGAANADFEKWLEELKEKTWTPWWLEKIAETLLRVEHFRSVVITQT